MGMKMLISLDELKSKKCRDDIMLECELCHKPFYAKKNFVMAAMMPERENKLQFCSKLCRSNKSKEALTFKCTQCEKEICRSPSWCKTKNLFCSKSCSATWNNTHKTTGTRRSKLEMWIEKRLVETYPSLPIDYNKTNAIDAELDIYIPSLKLAFELNGIYHYEPIHGKDKLNKVQSNDTRKFQACLEQGIELCIIDIHNVKYLKEERDKKFLDIINNIICQKI